MMKAPIIISIYTKVYDKWQCGDFELNHKKVLEGNEQGKN